VRFGYELFYAVRWAVFLIRLTLSFIYGLLQFIAKPGSRFIVPCVIAVVGYLNLTWLQGVVDDAITGYNAGSSFDLVGLMTHHARRAYYGYAAEEWQLDAALIAIFLLACAGYVILSRVLALVLGAFPQITRPLRPLRRLRPTNQKITSAVVLPAVPKLRRGLF
jgi:hypothetical protein